MKKNDAIKKHHFWLLLGVVPLLTLIGAMIVSSSVGGAIAERQKKLDDMKAKISSAMSAKPKALIGKAEELVKVVSGKQGGLHKDNWDRQKNLFTWPAGSPLLRDIEYGENNVEKAADRIIEVGLPGNLKPDERAAKVKEARDELAKLSPLDRTTRLKEMLDQLPLNPAQRKALLEPAWPKFGDPLPNTRGEFDEFRKGEVYRAQFSTLKKDGSGGPGTGMADRVAPTQFQGGWQAILRHVTDFGQVQLTSDQAWLMMEDIWVQRSMLDAVRSINEEMASFHRAKLDKDGHPVLDKDGKAVPDPSFDDAGNKVQIDSRTGRRRVTPTPEAERRKAVFANRTWALALEVVRDGDTQRLTGTLTNLTDRLQLLGVGNIMTVNVWFKNSAQPFAFRIGGEYVPGRGMTVTVKEPVLGPDGKPVKDADGKERMQDKTVPTNVLRIVSPDHVLPAGTDANAELLRVEQVFDVRTVPVKRIDALALGQREALDARNAAATLLPPPSPPFAKEKEPEAAETGTTGVGPAGAPMGAPTTGAPTSAPGETPGMTPGMIPGMTPGARGTSRHRFGGGTLAAVIDGNKKRYLITSTEVRRMPVGIVVVIDQSLIQDMLLAFANSPLRFQITQVEWTSFAGKLDGAAPSTGSPGQGGGIDFGTGTVTFGGSGDPDARGVPSLPGVGPLKIGPAVPPGLGVGTTPGSTPASMPGMIPGMPGGIPGMPGYGGTSGRNASTVSESQITSGLVELSIYGVVSLYEKYEPKPAEGAAAAASAAPAQPAAPAAPTNPAPAQPAAPPAAKPAPKMRRRGRR
jgi:hypothetical protein